MTLDLNPRHFQDPIEDVTELVELAPVAAGDVGNAGLSARLSPYRAPAALAAGDAGLYLACGFGLSRLDAGNVTTERLLVFTALAAVISFASSRLYPGYRLHSYERLRRRVHATLTVGVSAAIGLGLLIGSGLQLALVGTLLALGLVLQPLVEGLLAGLLHRIGIWGEPAAIVGTQANVAAAAANLQKNWRYGICPVQHGTGGAKLALLVQAEMPQRVDLDRLIREFDEIILLADLPELRLSGLRPVDLGGQIGVLLARGSSTPSAWLPRLIDIAIALPALVSALPLILVAAVLIKVVDPGPAFYRQEREGMNRLPFQLLKLRTMYQDSTQRLEALLVSDPAARAEWETYYKLRHDPRILPVIGRLLRATSFDELPQLFNILSGDMRLVGPRPFPDYHLQAMDQVFRARRCSILPGLTGLWQISGRSSTSVVQQQAIDDFYITNRSYWLDFDIIVRTASALVRGRGAY